MKYRPGDKVKVRSDLKINDKYEKYVVIKEMQKFSGKVVTIADCLWDGYSILEDNRDNGWTDEMFEDIKEEQMDNNTLQINMNNLTDEERNTLLSLVKKSNEPKSKVWKPKFGLVYYFISNNGEIEATNCIESIADEERFVFGNCFKTEDEAKFALEKLKVITELKRFAIEHNEGEIDWSDSEQKKYYIYYSCHINRTDIDFTTQMRENIVYFTSQEIATQAIQEIGEERLKKYYFEVND